MSASVEGPRSGRLHDAICAWPGWWLGGASNNSGGLRRLNTTRLSPLLARASLLGPLPPHDQRAIAEGMDTPSRNACSCRGKVHDALRGAVACVVSTRLQRYSCALCSALPLHTIQILCEFRYPLVAPRSRLKGLRQPYITARIRLRLAAENSAELVWLSSHMCKQTLFEKSRSRSRIRRLALLTSWQHLCSATI